MKKNLLFLFIFLSLLFNSFGQSLRLKVFNKVTSLSLSDVKVIDKNKKELLPEKLFTADSNLTDKTVLGWKIENTLSTPTEALIISRTLSDFDLTFYVFDSSRNLLETKRIYWGMPSDEREENSYLPIKSIFIDAHKRLEVFVVIENSFRQVVKPIFEINSQGIRTEFLLRKIIDAILTAFLITNLIFSVWLFKKNQVLKDVLKFYFLYNLFILLFFFLRYFLSYFNSYHLPIIINYMVNICSYLAYFCYYFFGMTFINTKNKATNTEKILLSVTLLTFLNPSISFNQTTLIIRTIIVFLFLANLYRLVFLYRKHKQTKIFFFISLPLLLLGGFNGIYGILYTDAHLKFNLELSKISIIAESVMLFGGLITRNRD
jgi:hypothetical protein